MESPLESQVQRQAGTPEKHRQQQRQQHQSKRHRQPRQQPDKMELRHSESMPHEKMQQKQRQQEFQKQGRQSKPQLTQPLKKGRCGQGEEQTKVDEKRSALEDEYELQLRPCFPAQPQQCELQSWFAAKAWEISGLLRPSISSEAEFNDVQCHITELLAFLVQDLPNAAQRLDVKPRGLVFQALLAQAGCGRGACLSQERMHRVLGKDVVSGLADLSCRLCGFMRVKIEDDADLALARRALEDCRRFFSALTVAATKIDSRPWLLFQQAMGL